MIAKSIFGPPGTGKTTRALGIIESIVASGVDPKAVSFLSFTRAAAGEALKRMGLKKSDNVSTLHSLCYRLMKLSPQVVMDTPKLKIFCEDAGIDMGFTSYDSTEYDAYLSMVNLSRNAMIDLDEAYVRSGGVGSLSELYLFSDMYSRWKSTYGAVDYDDMLSGVLDNRLFPRVSHIMVDEAQDLTPLQWKVIDQFSSHKNIKEVYICGDDDQALYTWAGADAHGMKKFEDRFCGKREVLSQSYRVPKSVHSIAMNIINRVSDRVEKEYKPRDHDGTVEMAGEVDVSSFITNAAPFMVIGRTNYVLGKVAAELRENGVSYTWNGEGGAWRRDAGLSIRVWKKLQNGEDISQREMNVVSKVLTMDAKKAINRKDPAVFKKSWDEVMVLPPEAMEQIEVHGEESLTEAPNVELCTVHAAKGRECENVILLTDMTERVRESMDSDPDSEARVFYVGVTRAISNLTIVGACDGYPI